MIDKKKIIQKGGILHNEIFTEYFSNIIKLINYLLQSKDYTNEDFSTELNSINRILPNLLFQKLINILKKKIKGKTKLERQIKKNLFLIIFRHIVKFINQESFIAKLLNIYIYMLFINYLIAPTENGHKKTHDMLSFSYLITAVHYNNYTSSNNNNGPDFNEIYYENMNRKLSAMKNSFTIPDDFSRKEFLGRIKALFIEKYSERVPVFYGNDYVGNLRNKRYIINPVGAFILKLYKLNITHYKRRLLQLLQSVIGSDKIPNLKFMSSGTEFCIIKEENHEKICEEVRKGCARFQNPFRSSLYNNKMIAEISEENIASDEHILELLDILLRLYIENNEKILNTNAYLKINERNNFNLQQTLKSLSSQRREFARRALSNNNF